MSYLDPNLQITDQTQTQGQESNIKNLTEAQGGSSAQPSTGQEQQTPGMPRGTNFAENVAYLKTGSIKPGTSGSISERILNPLSQGIQGAQGQLETTKSNFYNLAGNTQPWSTVQPILQNTIKGTTAAEGTPEYGQYQKNYEASKNAVGAKYSGPESLDTTQLGGLDESINRLYGYGRAAKTPGGLQELVSQAVPGLRTGGEQRQEAGYLQANPEFQAGLTTQMGGVEALKGTRANDASAAEQYAKNRASEETALGQQTRDWLTAQRTSDVENPIATKIKEDEARRQAVMTAMQNLQQQGTMPSSDLAPGVEATGEYGQKSAEAEKMWSEIMAKYQDIANVPLLQWGTTGRGRVTRQMSTGYSPDQYTPEQNAKIVKRQEELEYWFSPGAPGGPGSAPEGQGIYSTYKPLYGAGGQTWASGGIAPYVTIDQGTGATFGNQINQDQLREYNTIQGLLDQVPTTMSKDPYRAAKIMFEAKRWIDDQKASLEKWDTIPTKAMQDWYNGVKDLENKWDDANSFGSNPLGVSLGAMGLGGADAMKLAGAMMWLQPWAGAIATGTGTTPRPTSPDNLQTKPASVSPPVNKPRV